MTGGNLLNKSLALLFLVVWVILQAGQSSGKERSVTILVSDNEEVYSNAIAGFTAEVDQPVTIYNLEGDVERAPALMARILQERPLLIFALGAKAAVVSKVWTKDHPEIPVIFAMVLNWERYNLLKGQENIAGIAYDIAPGTHLANLAMISPESNRIGIIYSKENSGNLVESARRSAEIFNMKVVARTIDTPGEFQRVFKSLEDDIDSFWILPDPVVYTLDNISWLEKRCLTDRIICLGPSKNVAKLGVVLSVDPDLKNIGVQAASMARSILEYKQQPWKIGVMAPIGTRLFINLRTANKIGLRIGQSALDQATQVIDQ